MFSVMFALMDKSSNAILSPVKDKLTPLYGNSAAAIFNDGNVAATTKYSKLGYFVWLTLN